MQIRQSLTTARRMTLGLVEATPEEHWLHQPCPGANHVTWTLIHLTLADDWGPTSMGDPRRPWVEKWDALLSRGPVPDGWPPHGEILDALSSAHDRFLACVASLSDADLDRPTAGTLADYAPDLACLLHSHIWHEAFHAGQIAVIRKSIGLPPRFG